jgi:hypothetical protein
VALEQVYYSWATKELGGRNQLQIVGLSEGLTRAPMLSVMPAVRRLCRFDFPAQKRQPQPISFGWFDFESFRLAFCRVALDAAPAGNFSAHILVGSRDEVSESCIASLFASPFWWTGQALVGKYPTRPNGMFEIPSVTQDAIPRVPSSESSLDPDAVDSLIHMLVTLGNDGKVAVNENSWVFGEQIRLIASECPVAFDGVSLSTYEDAPVFPFTIVGDQNRRAGRRTIFTPGADALDPAARETLARLRASTASSRTLFGAAAYGSSELRGAERRLEFWHRLRGIVAVALGLDASQADLVTALDTADGAAYLASHDQGKSRIAAAISADEPGVRALLRQQVALLAPETADALSVSTLANYLESGDFGGCGAAAALFPPPRTATGSPVLAGILDALIADPACVQSLQPDDMLALLRQATETRIPETDLLPLIVQAAPEAARIACDPRVADAYVTAMLPVVLRDPTLYTSGIVAEVLTARPSALTGVKLNADEQANLAQSMASLGARALTDVLQSVLTTFTSLEVLRDVRILLDRVPLPAASRLVAEAARGRMSPSPLLAQLCDDLAEQVLIGLAQTGGTCDSRDLQLPLALLANSESRDSAVATTVLECIGVSRSSYHDLIRSASAALGIDSEDLRKPLWEMVIRAAVSHLPGNASLGDLWGVLDAAYPTQTDTLRALLRFGRDSVERAPRFYILVWVGDELLRRDPSLVSKSGQLKDNSSQLFSEQIIERWPNPWLEQWESVADRSGAGASQWRRHLIKHARKVHREGGAVGKFVGKLLRD